MIRQECNICNIPIERAERKMLICWPESQIFMSHPDAEIANSDIYGSAAYWVPEEVVTGEISEIAALVAWLCSSECSFSTGAVFDISGGRATY